MEKIFHTESLEEVSTDGEIDLISVNLLASSPTELKTQEAPVTELHYFLTPSPPPFMHMLEKAVIVDRERTA